MRINTHAVSFYAQVRTHLRVWEVQREKLWKLWEREYEKRETEIGQISDSHLGFIEAANQISIISL